MWGLQQIDEQSQKLLTDRQLKLYNDFLDSHAQSLDELAAFCDIRTQHYDAAFAPFTLEAHCERERIGLFTLLQTDNKILKKVLAALVTDCTEVRALRTEAERKFIPTLAFYGDGQDDVSRGDATNGESDGDAQIRMGRLLRTLYELTVFAARCYDTARNMVAQLSALYTTVKNSAIDTTDVQLDSVFASLGQLLGLLVTLDTLFAQQANLERHFSMYKRMLNTVHYNVERFDVDAARLAAFEQLIRSLEKSLFDGRLFRDCIEQNFEGSEIPQANTTQNKAAPKQRVSTASQPVGASKNTRFAEEFAAYLRRSATLLETKLDSPFEMHVGRSLVELYALYACYVRLFRVVPDKKLFRILFDLHIKLPAVHLVANIVWLPAEFMLANSLQIEKLVDKKLGNILASPKDRNEYFTLEKVNWLQKRVQSLNDDVSNMEVLVTIWSTQLEREMGRFSNSLQTDLHARLQLFIQGACFAATMNNQARTLLAVHEYLQKPITKSTTLLICRLIELVKIVQTVFFRRSPLVAYSVSQLSDFLLLQILNLLQATLKRLTGEKKPLGDRAVDQVSALRLAETVLSGPGTYERRLIARISLEFAMTPNVIKLLKEDEFRQLKQTTDRFELLCELDSLLRRATDCTFLFSYRHVFGVYVRSAFEQPCLAVRMRYLLSALSDVVRTSVHATVHLEARENFTKWLQAIIVGQIEKELITPLCSEIETALRLQTHSHLQTSPEQNNPFLQTRFVDLTNLFRLPPLRFLDALIDVRARVEHYLSRTFYNLTTVALSDWKTYGEMSHLARHVFGLEIIAGHLPAQTLEQGLDILTIMRTIHVFVANYRYNLNNQIFVEKNSNNKYLNTLCIRHVANSIRTHGIGIMNTTVNFTYQFLRKKFYIFSQFLYDEHIKARLIKDLRNFREHQAETKQKYSYERADKFNKGIRKLGVTSDGSSYLDQFRELITQVGNALGYVRLIRNGGLHGLYNAIRFIPDLDEYESGQFERMVQQANLSTTTLDAARQLDAAIQTASKNFTESAEYFKSLVDVFAPEFRNPKNVHLKNFFVIVPPLTINFVEHSISLKEKLNKKNKTGAGFTDDGFAMGVAYILKLLDQYSDFDSLHWFASIREKYARDKAEVRKQQQQQQALLGTNKMEENLMSTLTLTLRRLEQYEHEFELLNYSVTSARIFFRYDLQSGGSTAARK